MVNLVVKQRQEAGEIQETKPHPFLEQRSRPHTTLKLCKVAQEDPQSIAKPCRLEWWFSKCGPQTSCLANSWGLVRNANFLAESGLDQ